MRQHSPMHFDLLLLTASVPKRRGQSSFESGDATFNLHPLTILHLVESSVRLPAIFSLCPPASATTVELDHTAADLQFLAGGHVVAFGVVAAVAHRAIDLDAPDRQLKNGLEERRVLAGPVGREHVDQQVRGVVTRQRQLRPASKRIAFLPCSPGIMRGTRTRIHAGGVDARHRAGVDEALPIRVDENLVHERLVITFFKKRASALKRVA